jgi:hypothetical protein
MHENSVTLDSVVLKHHNGRILLVGSTVSDTKKRQDEYGYEQRGIQTIGQVRFIKPMSFGVLISTDDKVCFCQKECMSDRLMRLIPDHGITDEKLLTLMIPREY